MKTITVDFRGTLIEEDTVYFRYFDSENIVGFAPTESRTFSTTEGLIQNLLSTIFAAKETAKTIYTWKKNPGVRMFLLLPILWQVLIWRKLIAIGTTLSAAQISESGPEVNAFVNSAQEITLGIMRGKQMTYPKSRNEESTRYKSLHDKLLKENHYV